MYRPIQLLIILIAFCITPVQAQDGGCSAGDCENGYGVLETKNWTYYGSFLDGKKNFWGCQLYSNEQLYCGNWSEGEKHLFGTYYFMDGDNDFFMGLYDRGKQLRTGFYIDASAASGSGAISIRMDDIRMKTKYNAERNGTGCVAGDCENGFGVLVTDFGRVLQGSFANGDPNGWMCITELDGWEENITEVKCGSSLNNTERFVQYKFERDEDMNKYDQTSGTISRVTGFRMGLFDYYLLLGMHTGDPRTVEGRNLLYKSTVDGDIFRVKPDLSGAASSSDYRCLLGNCKEGEDGYSYKSNYNDGDWYGYQFYGNYMNDRLNGYACQYFPKHPKIDSETAQLDYLYCGNFMNGRPIFYGVSIYEGNDDQPFNIYFGLHDGYKRVRHGIYYQAGMPGQSERKSWLLESANYNVNE